MRSKGKEHWIIGHPYYKCNRCGMVVPASDWKGDTHSNCDEYLKGRAARDRVSEKASRAVAKTFKDIK